MRTLQPRPRGGYFAAFGLLVVAQVSATAARAARAKDDDPMTSAARSERGQGAPDAYQTRPPGASGDQVRYFGNSGPTTAYQVSPIQS